MPGIKERLDNLRIHIQEPEFLEGKGLSNEVNIRIFCYDAEDEMTVRQFIDQITTNQSITCNLVECNLYETFLALCDDIDITDAIPEMEEADGKDFLLEQLHSAIGEGEFIDKIQYEPHKIGDVLMLPGNGKFDRTGLGMDRDARESSSAAFSFLKANSNRISGNISTTMKDYIINYQDLQGIGMTGKLAMPTLIALASIALNKPVQSSMVVLGEMSISGTLIKVDELANSLQVCLDSGAKKVLLPSISMRELGNVPDDLAAAFDFISYRSAEEAVFKALGVD